MALDNLRGGTKRVVEENTPLNNLRGGTKRVVIVDGGGGGLSSVSHDTTLKGNGTPGNPLGFSDDVLTKLDNVVPQYDTLPTASAENSGEIAQYSGATIPAVEDSATIEQTVGSTLSNLAVDVPMFVSAEQPSGAETVTFTALITGTDSVSFVTTVGEVSLSGSLADFETFLSSYFSVNTRDNPSGHFRFDGNDDWELLIDGVSYGTAPTSAFEDYNLTLSGTAEANDVIDYECAYDAQLTWSKGGVQVDIAAYGITYSGYPDDSDVISVSFVPGIQGYTNGYFYKVNAIYTPATAIAEQVIGSGLSDLSVDVATFEAKTQPQGETLIAFDYHEVLTPASLSTTVSVGEITVTDADASLFETALSNIGLDPSNFTTGWFVYELVDDPDPEMPQIESWVIYDNDQIPYSLADYGLTLANFGITISGTPQINDQIDFTYTPASSYDGWEMGAIDVNLAEYGVSYGGTAVDGDRIRVTYTPGAVSSYAWERTDVQPSSGSGGSSEIEWVTKVDLPAEYTGDDQQAAPYYTIVGGLPDGEYEFYFSTKQYGEYGPGYAILGETIFKVKMNIDNNNHYCFGLMGYVFDGDYTGGPNNVYGYGDTLPGFCRGNGGDLILYSANRPFASDVLLYNNHQAVPECFKLSAIKNTQTGEKYIATGNINLDGNEPTYTDYWSGNIFLNRLVNDPYIPSRVSTAYHPITSLATGTFYFSCQQMFSTFNLEHEESDSVFVVNLTGKFDNGDYGIYAQEIVKATGVFSGCYLAIFNNRVYVMGVDTIAVASLSGNAHCGIGMLNSDGASIWFDTIIPSSTTPIQQVGSQGMRLGTITADGIGNIIQYTGTTDANYTNGYFYKATGTAVSVPASLVCTETSATSTDITCTDVANTLLEIETVTGWDESTVISQINAGSSWEYDADNSTLTFIGIDISSAIQYFSFSPAVASGTVTWTSICTPAHTEIQNGAWERVDVQPAGGGSYLPLTGGTLTGDLEMSNSKVQLHNTTYAFAYWLDAYSSGHLRIGKSSSVNNGDLFVSTGSGGSKNIAFGEDGGRIGAPSAKLEYVHTQKLNNGADIAVPNTAGTMVVATPPSADGTYVLKATVADGVVTTTWVAE